METLQTSHLQRHHPTVSISGMRQKESGRQVFLPTEFRLPLTVDSDHAKVITNAIRVFIGADIQPYSVIENAEFKFCILYA